MDRWIAGCLGIALLGTGVPSLGQEEAPAAQEKGEEEGEAGFAEITPVQERAIEKGLAFLAAQQAPDGSWGGTTGQYRVAMTALAGLAFLAHGDTPDRGEYAEQVRKGVEFLLTCSDSTTGLISDAALAGGGHGSMHGHGFALLFLAEVYGMSSSGELEKRLKRVLRNGVKLTERSQSSWGGWYYSPHSGNDEGSVTVTQVQGLRACRNAGILVSRKTIRKAIEYIKKSKNADGGIRYTARSGGGSRIALTAAGVAVVYGAGEFSEETEEIIADGLNYMKNAFQQQGLRSHGHFFYTHLYAVESMYLAGGDHWRGYFPKIRDWMVQNQHADGSWSGEVDTTYCTSIALIVLQVPYRYLPILQK